MFASQLADLAVAGEPLVLRAGRPNPGILLPVPHRTECFRKSQSIVGDHLERNIIEHNLLSAADKSPPPRAAQSARSGFRLRCTCDRQRPVPKTVRCHDCCKSLAAP